MRQRLFKFLMSAVVVLAVLACGCRRVSTDYSQDEVSAERTENDGEVVLSNERKGGIDEPGETDSSITKVITNNKDNPQSLTTPAKETAKEPKRLWAYSYLWSKAPEIEVEKWLTERPDTDGKYVLLEIWTTWCSQCARSVKDLNKLHEKYSDEMVIIGITDEPEEKVENFRGPDLEYYSAVDTRGRVKKQLGVKGYPHVIIIEPGGYVVWEGFPYLEGYELTEEKIEKILAVGRKQKQLTEADSR